MSYVPVYPEELWQKAYMRQLGAQIAQWKREYYYSSASVDDATYDLWWSNLLYLEKTYPHLKDPNSPTIDPGAPLASAVDRSPARMKISELLGS